MQQKTELVQFSKKKPKSLSHTIAGQEIQVQEKAKCLGVWWQYDLSPTTSVEECISKARHAFFSLGSMGAFQGRLNPLTGSSLFEIFVVPTMLFGCKTWILTESHISSLESFQAEIGKRILGLSKHHSNLFTLIGLHWPSVRCRILIRKLGFLAKLLSSDDKLSSQVFRTLASDDVYNVSLIQQSHSLEQYLGSNYVQLCLQDPSVALLIISEAKNEIISNDWKHTLSLARSHSSLNVVNASVSIASSWNCYWGEALEYGIRGTKLIQNLYCCLSRPVFRERKCLLCSIHIVQGTIVSPTPGR